MKVSKYHIALYAILAAFVALIPPMLGMSYSSAKAPDKKVIVLSSKNTLVLGTQVDGDSVGNLLEKARDMDSMSGSSTDLGLSAFLRHIHRQSKSSEPIYVFLNTPGGEIQSGMELIEGLNGLNRPVCSITAFAASMGLQIAQGLNGDRYILNHGIMMAHQGTGEFSGQFGGVEPSQAFNRYRIWSQRLKEMDERTVARTKGKQTLESYQKAYTHEMWVTGQEAIEQGYADSLVQLRCDDSLDGVSTHHIEFMGMPVDYDMDNCPISTSPRNVRLGLLTNHGRMSIQEFKEKHGVFGPLCLQEAVIDSNLLCALDTSLSYEKLEQIKSKFVDSIENKQNNVIPLSW